MSARESSKSKTRAFSRIRSGWTDFGITTRSCWRPQRIKIWAGVRPEPGHGPVDEVQVDGIDAELPAALLERPERSLVAVVGVPEFRRDEDLVPLDLARTDRVADIPLVPVELRGVDQSIPNVEGR